MGPALAPCSSLLGPSVRPTAALSFPFLPTLSTCYSVSPHPPLENAPVLLEMQPSSQGIAISYFGAQHPTSRNISPPSNVVMLGVNSQGAYKKLPGGESLLGGVLGTVLQVQSQHGCHLSIPSPLVHSYPKASQVAPVLPDPLDLTGPSPLALSATIKRLRPPSLPLRASLPNLAVLTVTCSRPSAFSHLESFGILSSPGEGGANQHRR